MKIYLAAPYPYLYRLISDLWEKAERTQSVFASVPEHADASVAGHYRIVGSLRKKDFTSFEALIKRQKNRISLYRNTSTPMIRLLKNP